MLQHYRHRRIAFGIGLALSLLLFAPGVAGDAKKLQIEKNSPEGQFLELIALESDGAKKTALLEQFLIMFPKVDPSVTVWVYGELQDRYRRAGALDKAMTAGERILSFEPDNIEAARANWRIAEARKDPNLIQRWSTETAKIAERVVKAPLPTDPAAMKEAEERAAYARQFVVNTDYQDFTSAIQTENPEERINALEEFVKKSPQKPYMEQIEIAKFLAWKQIGNMDKTLAAAEAVLARNENREDALILVAEVNFRRKKDPQRTLALATKFIDRTAVASKPDGITEQDWARFKSQNLALAHFIIGSIHSQAGQWGAADKAFRAGLPLIADDQFRATVLYQLGWANYQMHNALEAIRFYRMCAAIPGPMQQQASQNVASVKSEYNVP